MLKSLITETDTANMPLIKFKSRLLSLNQQNKVIDNTTDDTCTCNKQKTITKSTKSTNTKEQDNDAMHGDYITHVLFLIHLKWP